ncbi:MAG: GNAT family N-acetyltransferase [Phycisphaerales bacterium]|nr:MAG: GNAT family N-acetyltransferase [Phycisphaerales bacterium]
MARAQLALHKEEPDIHSGLFRIATKRIARTQDYFERLIDDPESQVVVVEDTTAGKIVGLGLARICCQQECVAGRSGEIVDVWIEPSHRGKGLCTKVAVELTRFFKLNGVHSLTVSYAKEDLEAESLWYRLSFKPILVTAIGMLDEIETCFTTKSMKD